MRDFLKYNHYLAQDYVITNYIIFILLDRDWGDIVNSLGYIKLWKIQVFWPTTLCIGYFELKQAYKNTFRSSCYYPCGKTANLGIEYM